MYKAHGPWSIADVVQVKDTVAVETRIHRAISSFRNKAISGHKELFDIPLAHARELIRTVPSQSEITGYPKLEKCFFDPNLSTYLDALFAYAGLKNFVDDQGAWTLSLFTSTAGGRFFTINIGSHEVAFSSRPSKGEANHFNFLMVDRLVLDYPEVKKWAKAHGGNVRSVHYRTKRDRAVGIEYRGTLADSVELLKQPGLRRSLIAYWTEGLLEMRELKKQSSYKNSHQWNAVAELVRRHDGTPSIVLGDLGP